MLINIQTILKLIPESCDVLMARPATVGHPQDVLVLEKSVLEIRSYKNEFRPLSEFKGWNASYFNTENLNPSGERWVLSKIPNWQVFEMIGGDSFRAPTKILVFASGDKQEAIEWMVANTPQSPDDWEYVYREHRWGYGYLQHGLGIPTRVYHLVPTNNEIYINNHK